MPPPVVGPFINGHRFSFASIDVIANGRLFYGVTRIAYGSSLKPGSIRGSDTERIGRTPGESEHKCEMEMYQHEFQALIESLGAGWGLVPFDVVVAFDERNRYDNDSAGEPEGVVTHSILGCRITDVDLSSQEGTEANKVRLVLDPVTIGYGTDDLTIDWRPDQEETA
jgi:hypothetical protein